MLLSRMVGTPERGTLMASAIRTANTSTGTINWAGFKAVVLFLNTTAASGTGGLMISVEYLDPVSGAWNRNWNDPVARITSTGLRVTSFGPGFGVQAQGNFQAGVAAIPLGSAMRIQITHGDASNYTYSLGYEAL